MIMYENVCGVLNRIKKNYNYKNIVYCYVPINVGS